LDDGALIFNPPPEEFLPETEILYIAIRYICRQEKPLSRHAPEMPALRERGKYTGIRLGFKSIHAAIWRDEKLIPSKHGLD
jgi:hypothetical protein